MKGEDEVTKEEFSKLSIIEMQLVEILEHELDAKNYSDLCESYMKIALVVRRNEFRYNGIKPN